MGYECRHGGIMTVFGLFRGKWRPGRGAESIPIRRNRRLTAAAARVFGRHVARNVERLTYTAND